jgi:hypothetical protein
MPKQPDVEFAESMLHLLQRFTGNRPDALAQMRAQVENELQAGNEMAARAEAQLTALDRLEKLIAGGKAEQMSFVAAGTPTLKRAILIVLGEHPRRQWHRDELYSEVVRRGWGPGGKNPRNTFTARLRDLELEKPPKVRRIGQDGFRIAEGGEPH